MPDALLQAKVAMDANYLANEYSSLLSLLAYSGLLWPTLAYSGLPIKAAPSTKVADTVAVLVQAEIDGALL